MEVISGPRLLDKITIDFETGNENGCYMFYYGPSLKERMTIKQLKVSYKAKFFPKDGDEPIESYWEYKSNNNEMYSVWGELAGLVMRLEEQKNLSGGCDEIGIDLAFRYQNGEKTKMTLYHHTPGMETFLRFVSRLVVEKEELPEFLKAL